MTQPTSSESNFVNIFYRYPMLVKGLSLIGGFGVLSTGIVWAQTDPQPDTLVVPTIPKNSRNVQKESHNKQERQPIVEKHPRIVVPEHKPMVERSERSQKREPVREHHQQTPKGESQPGVERQRRIPERKQEPIGERPHQRNNRQNDSYVVSKKSRLSAPQLSIPNTSSELRDQVIPRKEQEQSVSRRETLKVPVDKDNNYIDSTDYSIGATRRYESPSAVVLSERVTGCRKILQNGQGIVGGMCGNFIPKREISQRRIPSVSNLSTGINPRQSADFNALSQRRTSDNNFLQQWKSSNSKISHQGRGIEENSLNLQQRSPSLALRQLNNGNNGESVRIGPLRISANGIGLNNSPRTIEYQINGTLSNPQVSIQNPLPPYYIPNNIQAVRPLSGNTSFIFPLSIPAPITSLFGWRIHPITGDQRFHSGTDLGAPQGTPVLAASSGQVASADWTGGYGLAVILQHNQTQESLYGHLSEIAVQPGQWVEQGTVIGLVGSTGNSTGPHLHFEWRQLTPEGWVAMDAGAQLQYSLAQLIQALQTAQAVPAQPQSGG